MNKSYNYSKVLCYTMTNVGTSFFPLLLFYTDCKCKLKYITYTVYNYFQKNKI